MARISLCFLFLAVLTAGCTYATRSADGEESFVGTSDPAGTFASGAEARYAQADRDRVTVEAQQVQQTAGVLSALERCMARGNGGNEDADGARGADRSYRSLVECVGPTFQGEAVQILDVLTRDPSAASRYGSVYQLYGAYGSYGSAPVQYSVYSQPVAAPASPAAQAPAPASVQDRPVTRVEFERLRTGTQQLLRVVRRHVSGGE